MDNHDETAGRLLIVANRLPVKVSVDKGNVNFLKSEGGLATGFDSLSTDLEKHWVGWPGVYASDVDIQHRIAQKLEAENIHPLFLPEEDVELYYEGFSNNTIWPLFHYFTKYVEYSQQTWEKYVEVNKKFHLAVKKVARPNDIIWVQDYHLMLLPNMLRNDLPDTEIGFFLHIPFPSYELFRTLPWRKEILEGILGADLVGFHTYEYMRHFISSTVPITNHESRLGEIYLPDRTVQVDAFPMGINYDKFHNTACEPEVVKRTKELATNFANTKVVLSVDRLDYSKGILQRLHAWELLLERNPELIGKITLLMLVVPSRDNVEHYAQLKEEIDELVGKINGRYSTLQWSPLHYYYRGLPFEELAALYKLADICLVTPLRDGMNLVAKEYIASREKDGVLILSEMAGSAIELSEAITVNPNSINEIADAVLQALQMKPDEQMLRILKMQRHIKKHCVRYWAHNFIEKLHETHHQRVVESRKMVINELQDELVKEYTSAGQRLIILDYDGTLVPFAAEPNQAFPDQLLLELLKGLSVQKNTTVVLISGRQHETLEEWFKDIDIQILAEHGMWMRTEKGWQASETITLEWMDDVEPVLEEFANTTPGAFIEKKDSGIAWHYRNCDPWIADIRVYQLINSLVNYCTRNRLEILDGNKVIEVKNFGMNKGVAAQHWLKDKKWDFVMALGDDRTDEDVFGVLPENAWGIKVGNLKTIAPYRLDGFHQVRQLLYRLLREGEEKKFRLNLNPPRRVNVKPHKLPVVHSLNASAPPVKRYQNGGLVQALWKNWFL